MNPFSFLSQVTVAAVEVKKAPAARIAKQYQPLVADLRIHASGAIFPSDALVAEFNLEYLTKGSTGEAYGIDLIDIAEMPAIKSPERFLAISFPLKSAVKVDIFGLTKYDAEGLPLTKVGEQGSATFGKETMLPLLLDVYGLVPNEEGFIDLIIHRGSPFNSPNGIFMVPKTVSRGEKKGEISYVRRENQVVYAITGVMPEEGEVIPADSATEGGTEVLSTDAPVEGSLTEVAPVETEVPVIDMTSANDDHDHAAELVDQDQITDVVDVIDADNNPFSSNDTPVFAPIPGTTRTK